MSILNRSLVALCILIPAAAMVAMGCGLFVLPETGPKALAANAHLIHFSVDIVDEDGTPLPDVTVEMTKYSLDANLIVGEMDKVGREAHTASGRYDCVVFGNYEVALGFSKPGYNNAYGHYAEADAVTHPAAFLGPPARTEPTINVKNNPHQRVILARLTPPQSAPQ